MLSCCGIGSKALALDAYFAFDREGYWDGIEDRSATGWVILVAKCEAGCDSCGDVPKKGEAELPHRKFLNDFNELLPEGRMVSTYEVPPSLPPSFFPSLLLHLSSRLNSLLFAWPNFHLALHQLVAGIALG